MIFDTHAHYDDEAFDDDREKLLERMQNRGVEYIVNVGASMSSCKSTIGLVRRFPYVYGALGVQNLRKKIISGLRKAFTSLKSLQ